MLGDGGAGVVAAAVGGLLGSPEAPTFRRPGVFAATTAAMRLIRARTPRKTRAVLRRLVLAGASLAGSIRSPWGRRLPMTEETAVHPGLPRSCQRRNPDSRRRAGHPHRTAGTGRTPAAARARGWSWGGPGQGTRMTFPTLRRSPSWRCARAASVNGYTASIRGRI